MLFNQDYAVAFDRFRFQPRWVISKYAEALSLEVRRLDASVCVLDVGCGSGHFALPFSRALVPFGGRLVAIDESCHMIDFLLSRAQSEGLANLMAINEDVLNHAGAYDVVWMSDVIHIFSDLECLWSRLTKNLRGLRTILIRYSSVDQLKSYEWGRFFPAALNYDLARHHETHKVLKSLEAIGFSDMVFKEIDETRLVDANEYMSFFKARYLSSLRTLTQRDFEDGIYRMKRWCKGKKGVVRNARTSLLIARMKY